MKTSSILNLTLPEYVLKFVGFNLRFGNSSESFVV